MGRFLLAWAARLVIAVTLGMGWASPLVPTPTQAGTDPARTSWMSAQRAFIAALGDSGEAARWQAYVQALVPYLGESRFWQVSAEALQASLNAGSPTMGYVVQQWNTLVGRLRLITVSNGGPPTFDNGQAFPNLCFGPAHGGFYAAQVLVWPSSQGRVIAQEVWQERNYIQGAGIMVGGNLVLDVRAWRSLSGATQLAVLEQTPCGASGWSNAFTGATLPRGATTWQSTHILFPQDPIDTDQASKPFASFLDAAGQQIRIRAFFSNNAIGACDGCEHLFAERIVSRGSGDTYYLHPWHILPGPYPTLVRAAEAAERVQKAGGISACTTQTVAGFVLSTQVAIQFCQLNWSRGAAWVKTTPDDDGDPHYKHFPIVYDLSLGSVVGTDVVHFTVSPVQGDWLITQVAPSGQ